MRRFPNLLAAVITVVGIMACRLSTSNPTAGDEVATIVAATLNAATSTAPTQVTMPPTPAGTSVLFPGGSLHIPQGLASDASSETIAAVAASQDVPGWDSAPAHVRIALQGYLLQGKFHEPHIVIYPAEEYAAANESAAKIIQQLRDLLSNPGAPLNNDVLPHVPFFNAGPVINVLVDRLPFMNGQGIRALTEYAQYYAPINNDDLFYHFQGLTNDGKMYIVAIFPVTAPLLAADSGWSTVPPDGGVVFPGDQSVDSAEFEAYYTNIRDLLNGTPKEQFQPTLDTLDALIQSLEVSS